MALTVRSWPAPRPQTVEKLTKGTFTKAMLIYAVCFGVGTGMTVGATVPPPTLPLPPSLHPPSPLLSGGDRCLGARRARLPETSSPASPASSAC